MSDKNISGVDDHTGREVIPSRDIWKESDWKPPVHDDWEPPGGGLFQGDTKPKVSRETGEIFEEQPSALIPVVSGEIILEGTPDEQALAILGYLSEIDRALTETEDIGGLIKLKGVTDAVAFLAGKSHQELAIQNRATIARAETLRKIGEKSIQMGKSQGARTDINLVATETKLQVLTGAGLTKHEIYACENIARLPRTKMDKYIAEANEARREITTGGLIVYSKELQTGKAINSSEDINWYTPPKFIAAARLVMGAIDIDPATSLKANEVVQAQQIYTVDDDGLEHDWIGRVWLNPPYGVECREFIDRLLDQYAAGITLQAIVLLNAHITETKWFAPLWDYTICFTHGRINHYREDGTEGAGSNHGSLFVYLGGNPGRFTEVFKEFGPVVRRVDRDY